MANHRRLKGVKPFEIPKVSVIVSAETSVAQEILSNYTAQARSGALMTHRYETQRANSEGHSVRDPQRIPVILDLLEQYWSMFPDLRIGQIIGNFAAVASFSHQPDAYYMEDDQFVGYLQGELSRHHAVNDQPEFTEEIRPPRG